MKIVCGTVCLLLWIIALPGHSSDITFDPNEWSGSTGNTFTLNIVGRDFQENVDGGGINFAFNPSLVQVNSVSVDETVWDFFVDEGSIDNNAGAVTGIVFNAFSPVGPGDFVVASVEFTAVGVGCGDLALSEYPLNPFAGAGFPINPIFIEGKIGDGVAAGDLNGDCDINAADILILLRMLNAQISPMPYQQRAGDVAPLFSNVPTPDGQINLGDLLVIQRKALGLVNFDFAE